MERGDHLSEILDFVEVRSAVSGGSVVEGRWRTASTIDNDLKFIAVVHGSARLQVDGVPEVVELGSGDVAVLNGRSWLKIEGGQGDDEPRDVEPPDIAAALPSEPLAGDVDALIGGRIDFDPVGREFLLRTLPPLLHARAEDEAGRFLHGTCDGSSMSSSIVVPALSSQFGSMPSCSCSRSFAGCLQMRTCLRDGSPRAPTRRCAPPSPPCTLVLRGHGDSRSLLTSLRCPGRPSQSDSARQQASRHARTCTTGGCSSPSARCVPATPRSRPWRAQRATDRRARSAPRSRSTWANHR